MNKGHFAVIHVLHGRETVKQVQVVSLRRFDAINAAY
jgi:hypothetical protein